MKPVNSSMFGWLLPAVLATAAPVAYAAMGELDPPSVVEKWSAITSAPKIIDINFSDASWPFTWTGSTGVDCPAFSDGCYVNAVLDVPAGTDGSVKYPVLFHNCAFAPVSQINKFAAATAAFSRQYYAGQKATNYNDWKQSGHTTYLEDNIEYNEKGIPVYGEAGYVQMCRDASTSGESLHGWMEIDHIPYVETLQWSWSSTSWGRGIKCDIKIGDGDWKPLVWMGSEKQKQGWTVFSDQGYFMENEIKASDVSLRWRVWDGEDLSNPVQTNGTPGQTVFTQAINPMMSCQAPRVHKIRIYGNDINASQADYARANPVSNIGTPSDLSGYLPSTSDEDAPDKDAPVVLLTVASDGSGDHTTVQAAIDAVPDGSRGIIYITPGIYEENIYAGRKGDAAKFISLIGADASTTILTSGVSRGGSSTNTFNDCAALNVFTPRFYAENLTIRNTSGNVGQAEALYTNGDAHLLRGCVISGYQDTYKANVGSRGYFTDCVIEGAVDFIYDGGLEWFDNCELRCVKGGGYITAPASSSMTMSKVMYPSLSADNFYPGLFFRNCRLTAEDGVADGAYTLGRPWDERGGACFLNCTLGSHISRAGWTEWNGNGASSSMYEYGSILPDGSAVDYSGRASFSRRALADEVEQYFTPEFLFGAMSKVPFDYKAILNSAVAPTNFTVTPSAIIWEGNDMAAGYIVRRDGKFVALTPNTSFTFVPGEESGEWSVATVSRQGVTSRYVKATDATRTLAFATAEGFGKYASGGRGGKVVKVTSLADDGSEGTLRWAFNQHKGEPITIIFEVSGEIALASELRVNRADWTLAGQTAPGDGIVITRNKTNFGGSQNFIVRNMRFRIGQKSIAGDILAENACGAENCSNFIFDHCSFGWSVEENMNTADCHFLTVQYCIVHEGLYNAGHSKGVRGYGCQWGGSPATYHHNLLAHNKSRSCRFNGARGEDNLVFLEYINNVNYNYGSQGGCYGGENTAALSEYNGLNSAHECNFIANYYRPGSASDASRVTFVNSSYARDGATSWAPAKWYVSGNVAHGISSATSDNWSAMQAEGYSLGQIRSDARITPANPYHKYSITGEIGRYIPEQYMLTDFETADKAYATVVEKAGTVNRDKVEKRVAEEARLGTTTYGGSLGSNSGIIDTERDAEGFFPYSTDYNVPADTDGDGMPDEWEKANGLNPSTADGNLLNNEGYTMLEVYLASLMGEELSRELTGIEAIAAPMTVSFNSSTSTLVVPAEALEGHTVTLEVFAADGRIVTVMPVATTETSLAALPRGFLLLRISAPGLTPRTLPVVH